MNLLHAYFPGLHKSCDFNDTKIILPDACIPYIPRVDHGYYQLCVPLW